MAFLFNEHSVTPQSLSASFLPTKQQTEKIIKGPVITLLTKSFNADTVLPDTPLTYNVLYKNSGQEPLIITKVRTSCSCTVASYSSIPIQKNETGKVVLKLDTQKPGTFIKTVAIYSNATNNYDKALNGSRTVFKIKWVVKNNNQASKENLFRKETK